MRIQVSNKTIKYLEYSILGLAVTLILLIIESSKNDYRLLILGIAVMIYIFYIIKD